MTQETAAAGELLDRARDRMTTAPAMLSYGQVLELVTRMTTMDTKLDLALTLQGDVKDMEARMRSVENQLAATKGSGDSWRRAMDLLWGLALAIIATGVWYKH